MNLYGHLKEFATLVFRKSGSNAATIQPNTGTATGGDVIVELPPLATGTDQLVAEDTTQTITAKTIALASNTISGTASHVAIMSGAGALTTEAQLAGTRGGTGVSSTATFPTSGVVTTNAGSQILTNKTFDATANTLTNVSNVNVATLAGIERTKLGSGTASHVVINDGSGVMTSEAQLAGTRGGSGVSNGGTFTWGSNNITFTTSGVTSLTLPTSGTLFANPMNAAGQIIYGGASGVATALAAGTANYLLQSNGAGAPSWVTNLVLSAGTVGTPAVAIGTGVGIFAGGTNQLNLATNGISQLIISTAVVSPQLQLTAVPGDATNPGISFQGDMNTGFRNTSSGTIGVVTDGTDRLVLTTSTITSSLPVRMTGTPSATEGLLHVRSGSGQKVYITLTEDSVSDRWAIGSENGSGTLHFRTTNVSGTSRFSVDANGACIIGSSGQTQAINGAVTIGSGANTHTINTATAAGGGGATMTFGAGAAPAGAGGNPDVYWQVNINGGVYVIPAWLL